MDEKLLRHELIKLAHAKPELRPHLLPLLSDKTAATEKKVPLKGDFVQTATGEMSVTIMPKAGGTALAVNFKRFKNAYNQKKLTFAINEDGALVVTLPKAGAEEEVPAEE